MKQKNKELLEKFEAMTNWMVTDIRRAMFSAQANFLVGMGLMNYTEIVGSFICPDGDTGERFDAFFERMGLEYRNLLKRFNKKRKKHPHVVYDDLRCGLTHEYMIKRKKFVIYNSSSELTEDQINQLQIVLDGTTFKCTCGVMYSRSATGKGSWMIIDPKYWLDFENALESYWSELNDEKNTALRKRFFKRARQVNFLEFKVLP